MPPLCSRAPGALLTARRCRSTADYIHGLTSTNTHTSVIPLRLLPAFAILLTYCEATATEKRDGLHVAHGSHPSPFRPGSGAFGSAIARASALPPQPAPLTTPTAPETPLSELLSVKTGGKTTAAGAGPRPLLNLHTATTVAVATLAIAGVSMLLCGAPSGHHRDGRRPLLGSATHSPITSAKSRPIGIQPTIKSIASGPT